MKKTGKKNRWLDISDAFEPAGVAKLKAEKRTIFVFLKNGEKIAYKVMRYTKDGKIWVRRVRFMTEEEKAEKINHYGDNIEPTSQEGVFWCSDHEVYFKV